jgi:hypothetical protein
MSSNRFDNKKLLYLVGGLIVLLAITVLVRIPKENATLKTKIVDFDTLDAAKIIIYPKYLKDQPVEFNRNNGKWTVQQGAVISVPQKGAVQNIFSELMGMKARSLAAVSKSKWPEFEVTDSLATRVQVRNKKGKIIADMLVGKFSYKQVNNPYGGYSGNNVQGTSFVRVYGEKEIFSIDGFSAFFFSGKFEDWRDKTFIALNKGDVTNLNFTYPSDSSFTMIKKDASWLVGNQAADSVNTSGFLDLLTSMSGQDIKDNFTPSLNPAYQLMIEGNNLLNISVKCYSGENPDEFILNSSLNPDVFFSSKKEGLFSKIFKSKGYFFSKNKIH